MAPRGAGPDRPARMASRAVGSTLEGLVRRPPGRPLVQGRHSRASARKCAAGLPGSHICGKPAAISTCEDRTPVRATPGPLRKEQKRYISGRRRRPTERRPSPDGQDRPPAAPSARRARGGEAARGAGGAIPRLCPVDHHGPGPARRPRRVEARPPPHPLRHAGAAARPRDGLQEMREDRRRRDGRLPPPRRPGDLRRAGAARAGLLVPLPAGRRPGQFRQHRRRPGRRLPLHRSPDDGVRQAPARRHRARHGGPAAQLFGRQGGAGRAAGGLPEPARQRRAGHRGRHGDLHPAPQHRRALRCGAPPHRASRGRESGARRLRARAGLPHRRRLRRGRGLDRRKLPDRPRLLPAARPLGRRAGRTRRVERRSSPRCPTGCRSRG